MLKICRKRILKFVHENDNVKSNCMWVTPSSFRFFLFRYKRCLWGQGNALIEIRIATVVYSSLLDGYHFISINDPSWSVPHVFHCLKNGRGWASAMFFFYITTRKGRRCAVFTGSPFPSRVVSSLFPFSKERKPREEASLWSMSVTGLEASTKLACEQADVCAPMRACQSPTWSVRSVTHS